MERTKAELNFIDQMTRKLLVGWADHCIRYGNIPDLPARDEMEMWVGSTKTGGIHPDLNTLRRLGFRTPYSDHALAKGWLGKKTPHKLTSRGWATAAAFLKR